MTALLIHNHTFTEVIDLPDDVNTGDIISAFMDAFDRLQGQEEDVFEIRLLDGTIYYCEGCDNLTSKWSVYVAPLNYGYEWVADFRMNL